MYLFMITILSGVIILCLLNFGNASSIRLTAFNDSPYVLELYGDLKNEDVPSENDYIFLDENFRPRMCEDIIRSVFLKKFLKDNDKIDLSLDNSVSTSQLHFPYQLREFDYHRDNLSHFKEFVFSCPIKYFRSNKNVTVTLYVSKEYNVSQISQLLFMPGRFIFATVALRRIVSYQEMFLAEKSASPQTDPGFDVEAHYLRLRELVQPVRDEKVDPLCKLVLGKEDPRNQHYRICVAISTSSTFKDEIEYPKKSIPSSPCIEMEVSFKNTEAKNIAPGTRYFERVTECASRFANRVEKTSLFISRAYLSDAVFVYRRDPLDHKMYLVNVFTDLGIADELNSFDFFEN